MPATWTKQPNSIIGRDAQELAGELRELRLLTSEVLRANHLEESSGQGRSQELEQDVGNAPSKADAGTGNVDAKGHRGVEAASRHGSGAISAGQHRERNGQAIVLVLLRDVLLGGCYVHDHKRQHEGVEQLAKSSVVPREALGRGQVEAVAKHQTVANRSDDPGSRLHPGIHAHGLPVEAWASHGLGDAQGNGDGGVEVGPRDAAEGVDGHHQHAGDGHAGPGGGAAQDIATHREDEEEGPQKLGGELGGGAGLRHDGRHRAIFNESGEPAFPSGKWLGPRRPRTS